MNFVVPVVQTTGWRTNWVGWISSVRIGFLLPLLWVLNWVSVGWISSVRIGFLLPLLWVPNWVSKKCSIQGSNNFLQVTWAHPQFGQILATCSFDNKRARLFEAVPGDNNDLGRKRLVLVNSFEDKLNNLVTDIKFTPPQLGLALGMCSVDGYVRIMGPEGGDLKSWREMVHINIKHSSLSCLAFSESTRDNVLVAVGAEIVSTEESVVALGAQDLSETPKNAAPSQSSYFNLFYIDIKHADRGRSRNMALVSLDDPKLYVDSPVRACCFAPVLGRSFQYLAIGASSMIVYQIKSSKIMARSTLSYPPNFNNPYCAIWRLAWNITGTQLVGSTTHGNVFVWHLNSLMNWQLVRAAVANRNSDVSIERPIGLSEITVDTGGGSHS